MLSGPTVQRAPMRVRAAQDARGLDRGVLADRDVHVDRGALRVHDRDARELVGAVDPPLGQAGHVREVDAVVDAEREVGIGQRAGLDGPAGGEQGRQDVGQVELALGVVLLEAAQRCEQRGAVEHVQAGVDLADRELGLGRVTGGLRLDDALDVAVGAAEHAAVAARVLELHRGQRRRGPGLLVGGDDRGDRLARDQRHVAVQHDHGACRIDQAGRGRDGVAGPARSLLDRDLDAVGQVLGEQPLRIVDDDHPLRAGLARGEQRPQDHRSPADRVQDLGQR